MDIAPLSKEISGKCTSVTDFIIAIKKKLYAEKLMVLTVSVMKFLAALKENFADWTPVGSVHVLKRWKLF
jgi:hypothetical protein